MLVSGFRIDPVMEILCLFLVFSCMLESAGYSGTHKPGRGTAGGSATFLVSTHTIVSRCCPRLNG
eukprot:5933915-Amphidinium_carterae.1